MALAEGLCDLTCALQLRKSMEILGQVSRLVLDTSRSVELTALLGTVLIGVLSISHPRLLLDYFSQSLVGTLPSKLLN
jgi:hypothetical protein